VTSPAHAQEALEARLQELDRFGLGRPVSVLFTEYLAALVAEAVIDESAVPTISAAYHRARYGTIEPQDRELCDALAQLDAVVRCVSAMPDEVRRQLSERVHSRLPATAAPRAESEASADFLWGSPISNAERQAAAVDGIGVPSAVATKASSKVPPALDSSEASHAGRRGLRLRSVRLETAVVAILGLFFAGYFLRYKIDAAIDPLGAKNAAARGNRRSARELWKNEDLWISNLRDRALHDAAIGNDQPACLAFELAVKSAPRDAEALNSLAWLRLTSRDPEVRDSERGLELALRALALNRAPAILDTAAEAYFQAGNVDEAVKLEEEAIRTAPFIPDPNSSQFHALLEEHLREYEGARKSPAADTADASAN